MAHDSPRDLQRPARVSTFALMAVAYATTEVAAHLDGIPRSFGVVFGLSLFAGAVLASYYVPVPKPGQKHLPLKWTLLLGGLLALPILVEPIFRYVSGNGLATELQLANGLRNVGLGLCALSAWPVCRRLAGVVALFLALFSSAMGDQAAIPYLLALFALTGGVWLVLNHQASLANVKTAGQLAGEVERVRLRLPGREIVLASVLALAAAGVAFAGPKRVLFSLGELFPTSGGTGEYDPFSRGGVNDGPEEMSGPNANTAGMVDSDQMIESRQDSLIDAVSDMYGPPHKPRPKTERMVAAGFLEVKQSHKTPVNKRPSRDFETSRDAPEQPRKTPGEEARAVYEVEGRTPLHIRVAVYDAYDPVDQFWHEAIRPNVQIFYPEGGDWMAVTQLPRGDWYTEDDRHYLKVADAKENLVPTPPLMERFKIRRVDKPQYYEWDYEGVVALSGRSKAPSGVIVHTDCRTLDPWRMPESAFSNARPVRVDLPQFPDGDDETFRELRKLAKEWTADTEPGWPRINAILSKLRSEYTVDREATPPKNHPSSVEWFLLESKRGPEYLFATAAALMLRSVGYETRFCIGFYAGPESYDRASGHTPVRESDLHSWPEVRLGDGHWMVVEPTPGYDVLPPKLPLYERLMAAALALWNWTVANWVGVSAVLLALVLAYWRRRDLWDRVITLYWRVSQGRGWQARALTTVRLLERRARLAGCSRPVHETLHNWAGQFSSSQQPNQELAELVKVSEWAAYAPQVPSPWPESAVSDLCQRVARSWTYRAMQQSLTSHSSAEES